MKSAFKKELVAIYQALGITVETSVVDPDPNQIRLQGQELCISRSVLTAQVKKG